MSKKNLTDHKDEILYNFLVRPCLQSLEFNDNFKLDSMSKKWQVDETFKDCFIIFTQ